MVPGKGANVNRRVGFTTTIPVEVIFAAGDIPCDLNNLFITDPEPMKYIERAERDGFPRNMCNWIKGIYGVVMEYGIDPVITVMEGDCSNTHGLAEILQYRGVRTIPFSFPYDRDYAVVKREIEKLTIALGADEGDVARVFSAVNSVRATLRGIDDLTWKERTVSGYENHLWLIRSSDMLGDYMMYGQMAEEFLQSAGTRNALEGIPVGYIGVPPILLDFYDFVSDQGGHIVFNETQRQFSLPQGGEDIVAAYRQYTYPYGIFERLADIREEVARRRIRGIIHYVQGFCFRIMDDIILKDSLKVPILTIEGEFPKPLDSRTKLRIEAFLEMLKGLGDGEDEALPH